MDRIAMLQRTLDGANAMIRGVRADELTKPTPCTEWDVKGLINHMAGTCAFFTARFSGTEASPPPQGPVDLLGNDVAGSYARLAQELLEAARAPGVLERSMPILGSDLPGSVAITIALADELLHTWDLARALGRPYTMDADLAELVLQAMQQMMRPEFRGPGKGFAEAVPCPDDAPIQDRLVAFSGRQP